MDGTVDLYAYAQTVGKLRSKPTLVDCDILGIFYFYRPQLGQKLATTISACPVSEELVSWTWL